MIKVLPKIGRRSGRFAGELPFIITGTNDSYLAKAELLLQAPGTYDGFDLAEAQVEELYERSAADGIWEGTVQYADPQLGLFEPGDTSFTFDTGGGSQHVNFSKATRGVYGTDYNTNVPSLANAFYGNAIGVSSDSRSVEGVDLPARQFQFTETRLYASDDVTPGFLRSLYLLSGGTFNQAVYHSLKMGDFEIGELTLVRASGGGRGSEKFEIAFEFSASPNIKQFTIGGIIVGNNTAVVKYGWDYVWVKYKEIENTTAKTLATAPEYVVVERVFDPADYSIIENQP